MLRRLLGVTFAMALVSSAFEWSTPEATLRAAQNHPFISDALWVAWLLCAGAFVAVAIVICPCVLLLRRGRQVLRPLLAFLLGLSVVMSSVVFGAAGGDLRGLVMN